MNIHKRKFSDPSTSIYEFPKGVHYITDNNTSYTIENWSEVIASNQTPILKRIVTTPEPAEAILKNKKKILKTIFDKTERLDVTRDQMELAVFAFPSSVCCSKNLQEFESAITKILTENHSIRRKLAEAYLSVDKIDPNELWEATQKGTHIDEYVDKLYTVPAAKLHLSEIKFASEATLKRAQDRLQKFKGFIGMKMTNKARIKEAELLYQELGQELKNRMLYATIESGYIDPRVCGLPHDFNPHKTEQYDQEKVKAYKIFQNAAINDEELQKLREYDNTALLNNKRQSILEKILNNSSTRLKIINHYFTKFNELYHPANNIPQSTELQLTIKNGQKIGFTISFKPSLSFYKSADSSLDYINYYKNGSSKDNLTTFVRVRLLRNIKLTSVLLPQLILADLSNKGAKDIKPASATTSTMIDTEITTHTGGFKYTLGTHKEFITYRCCYSETDAILLEYVTRIDTRFTVKLAIDEANHFTVSKINTK